MILVYCSYVVNRSKCGAVEGCGVGWLKFLIFCNMYGLFFAWLVGALGKFGVLLVVTTSFLVSSGSVPLGYIVFGSSEPT